MSASAMESLLDRIEREVRASSNIYRTLVSNYEIHDIHINAADIVTQVTAEMKARQGEEPTKATKDLIKTEVDKMCKELFEKFHPSQYNSTNLKWTITSEFAGNSKKFDFVLASKVGKKANVFNTFKKAKQIAQRPLIKALNNKLKALNRGSAKDRELISSRRGFLDIGHDDESSVSLQRAARVQEALWNLDKNTSSSPLAQKVIKELSAVIKWEITRGPAGPPKDTIGISMESKSLNRASISKNEVSNLNKTLKSIADKIGTDWATLEGSDSPIEARRKVILTEFIKPLKGKKGIKFTKMESTKPKKSKTKKKGLSKKGGKASRKAFKDRNIGVTAILAKRGSGGINPLAIIKMLNTKLPETVEENMRFPALVNRTGKFAQSVRVTDVVKTPKGYPSFGYTYARSPYGVFEMGTGASNMATPERDPRNIINQSIREIAAELAIGRFYTRRH